MSAEKDLRLVSAESTKRLKWGGIIAGVIGWIAALSAIAVGGAILASTSAFYEAHQSHKKVGKHKGGH